MANSNTPFGLRPVGTVSGGEWTGAVQKFAVSGATAVFVGDAVTLNDDGTVSPATAGSLLLGVVTGIEFNAAVAATVQPGYLPASTTGNVFVSVGPDVIYEIQEDSIGGAMVAANVGSNGDLVAGAGSTVSGTSGHVLDSSDVIAKDASAASAQLRVWALSPKVNNDVGTYAKWLVRINEHSLTTATGL